MKKTFLSNLSKAALAADPEAFDLAATEVYKASYEALSALLTAKLPEAPKITPSEVNFGAIFSLGLTQPQLTAIRNYEQRLLDGDRRALDRKLRDRRFDRTALPTKGRPVDPKRVARIVERYRERTKLHQAQRIAQTAFTTAREMGKWQAAVDTFKTRNAEVLKWWEAKGDRHAQFNALGYVDLFHNYATDGGLFRYAGDPSAGASNIVSCGCKMKYKVV